MNFNSPSRLLFVGFVLIAASTAVVLLPNRDSNSGKIAANGIALEAAHSSMPNARVILLGSMHALSPKDALPARYLAAIESADEILFELDPEGKAGPDAALSGDAIRLHTTYPDGTSWQNHVADSTARRVSAHVAAEGIPLESLQGRRPAAVAQVLSGSRLAKAGFSKRFGVEAQLLEPARQSGKPMGGLETLEAQLQVFSSMTDAEQEAVLLQTLDELENIPDFGLRIAEAWRGGDTERIAALTAESAEKYPELARQLLFERNERIAEILAERASEDRTLTVIIGAAHLCGDESVAELLREWGFDVIEFPSN